MQTLEEAISKAEQDTAEHYWSKGMKRAIILPVDRIMAIKTYIPPQGENLFNRMCWCGGFFATLTNKLRSYIEEAHPRKAPLAVNKYDVSPVFPSHLREPFVAGADAAWESSFESFDRNQIASLMSVFSVPDVFKTESAIAAFTAGYYSGVIGKILSTLPEAKP